MFIGVSFKGKHPTRYITPYHVHWGFLQGKAPNPFARPSNSNDTVRFTQAFRLNEGKRVVKAVCVDPRNRSAEPSSCSTRNYVVVEADGYDEGARTHTGGYGAHPSARTQEWTGTTTADVLARGNSARDGADSSDVSSDDGIFLPPSFFPREWDSVPFAVVCLAWPNGNRLKPHYFQFSSVQFSLAHPACRYGQKWRHVASLRLLLATTAYTYPLRVPSSWFCAMKGTRGLSPDKLPADFPTHPSCTHTHIHTRTHTWYFRRCLHQQNSRRTATTTCTTLLAC